MQTSTDTQTAIFRPTFRSSKRAVVVGSGFGGSVATLRLAEAGIPTTLVERGRHWQYTGESSYPTLSGGLGAIDDGILWSEPSELLPGSVGMLEQYADGSMPVGVGACLGGGSMVYGGVLLQPRREIFEQALPDISYDAMNATYYPRVLSRVSGGPIPDDILESPSYTSMRVFIGNALAAGMEVVRSEVGFDWNVIREEVQGGAGRRSRRSANTCSAAIVARRTRSTGTTRRMLGLRAMSTFTRFTM